MRRRHFLGIVALGAALLAIRPARVLRRKPGRPATLRFHVAGVRFHPVAGRLKEGARVDVRAERFGAERCYALYSPEGERLGYVPRELTRTLNGQTLKRATLTEVRPFAVPWKRLGVTLELS